MRKQKGAWFPGLRLNARDRRLIASKKRGAAVSARWWKRIRILELLDEGKTLTETAEAVGTYRREVRRVGWRYLERGLDAALTDEARRRMARLLDKRQESAIVALVCSPPPTGYSRWTVVLAAHEAKRRGIVATVGRETIRRVFKDHELKPWREKNVVRA